MKKGVPPLSFHRAAATMPVLKLNQIKKESKGFLIRGAMVCPFMPPIIITSKGVTWSGPIINLDFDDETGLLKGITRNSLHLLIWKMKDK